MTSQSSRSPHRTSSSHALWSSLALALVLFAPAGVRAQQSDSAATARTDTTARPSTHQVKNGDTLWDLARIYLGDPFLWPEIYRLNTDVVEDPHWIYPGEMLRLPGATLAEPGIAVASNTPDQGEPADTGVTEMEVASSGPTLFHRLPTHRVGASTLQDGSPLDPGPAVRPGEYYAAPFVIGDRERKRSGSLVASTEIAGIASARERSVFQHEERVYMNLGGSTTPSVGDHYLVYRDGPDLPGVGQVVVPTGVVVVEAAGRDEAATVRIVKQFESVEIGQRVMPLDEFVPPKRVALTPVDLGPSAKILWIHEEPELASLQSYFIVAVGAREGVKLGDEFHVYRERKKLEDGVRIP
ncbi:MAG: LysM peptidoglycan-binding domain-containing protein, partial [Gemmatimonadaceae bacterium]|nr:LysM peptidoglycan-binding domain-containing protein [Gemmatimonadaceae bacterium]